MNPGELRNKIIVQKKTNTSQVNQNGVTVEIWEDVFVTWAAIEELRNKSFYKLNQIDFEISKRLKIRHNKKVEELMRVKYGNKFLEIYSVVDINQKHSEMYLMCGKPIDLDNTCKIYRRANPLGELNRPGTSLPLAGEYLCTFIHKNSVYSQENPNAIQGSNLILYGESILNVQPGDIVEANGVKYVASVPYRPKNHHTEVDIFYKKDV